MADGNELFSGMESSDGFDCDDAVGDSRESEDIENRDDVYAQLAQKERDLVLAAELGKALLDSNQELQGRYDQMLDSFNTKVEVRNYFKYYESLPIRNSQGVTNNFY